MSIARPLWRNPSEYLQKITPDRAVLFVGLSDLAARAEMFQQHFPGLTTYALKANPDPIVLQTLCAQGIRAFDVASPAEITLARRHCPEALLHYHNPVRSRAEIELARAANVRSYSVDCRSELEKLVALVPAEGIEVAVRFALPLKGASYDFGSKFGASPDVAADLLASVVSAGFTPALTFHPGTQLSDLGVWKGYINAAAAIAGKAGVRIATLNIGGGFPSRRDGCEHDLRAMFAAISRDFEAAFKGDLPRLVAEPGRAMVADAGQLAVPIKSVRETGAITLADGIYGGLSEQAQIGVTKGVRLYSNTPRQGDPREWCAFGPTCDSLDVLPDPLKLPGDIAEGDIVLFDTLGAYSNAMATGFNGYGGVKTVAVHEL